MKRILIAAIGNRFMRDDGVGGAMLDEMASRGSSADLIDLGTDIFKLSIYGEGYDDIIILDSLRGGGVPGTVRSFSGSELARSLDSMIRSAHLIGSIEALEMLQAVKPSLRDVRFHLVGIVAAEISTGEGLSPEVARSIDEAADAVEMLLKE
jgi:hydrogenase maturation protease